MLSAEELKRKFYTDFKSPYDRFSEEARRMVNKDLVVLHGGCGADSCRVPESASISGHVLDDDTVVDGHRAVLVKQTAAPVRIERGLAMSESEPIQVQLGTLIVQNAVDPVPIDDREPGAGTL